MGQDVRWDSPSHSLPSLFGSTHLALHPGSKLPTKGDPEGNHALRGSIVGRVLTRLQEGREVTMNSGLRAPPGRGDKTYKSWAAVGVLLEEDLRYLWLVEHLGLKGPLSVTWDEVLSEDG